MKCLNNEYSLLSLLAGNIHFANTMSIGLILTVYRIKDISNVKQIKI